MANPADEGRLWSAIIEALRNRKKSVHRIERRLERVHSSFSLVKVGQLYARMAGDEIIAWQFSVQTICGRVRGYPAQWRAAVDFILAWPDLGTRKGILDRWIGVSFSQHFARTSLVLRSLLVLPPMRPL